MLNLILGFIVGSFVTFMIMRQSSSNSIVKEYEWKIRNLEKEYNLQIKNLELNQQEIIKKARRQSTDASRAIIKGKVAEQMAPLLADFQYLPSDAKFLGDPIDYIVFNGYTDIKDNNGNPEDLEIIILDIKTGHSTLSKTQQAIEQAVKQGNVKFEVVRIDINEANSSTPLQLDEEKHSPPKNSIQEKRKKYPNAYKYWTKEEDKRLKERFYQGVSIQVLSQEFQRQSGGIRSRLRKLGLID